MIASIDVATVATIAAIALLLQFLLPPVSGAHCSPLTQTDNPSSGIKSNEQINYQPLPFGADTAAVRLQKLFYFLTHFLVAILYGVLAVSCRNTCGHL